MAVSHSENIGSISTADGATGTGEISPPCDQCIQRAFGILALSKEATSPNATTALRAIGNAQETWTYSGRTRATIYRCTVDQCSHAVLSFTLAGSPNVPDPANLHVELLPGTADCVLPGEVPEQAI